eukprot:10963514-Alexandrium_andersonii.AAC.1
MGTQGLPGASTAFRQVACSGRRPRVQPGLWVLPSRRAARVRAIGAPPTASPISSDRLPLGRVRSVASASARLSIFFSGARRWRWRGALL